MIEDSSNNIIRQKQKIPRNELDLNRERERLRKADTRRKIQLGELIVKAGLEEESTNVILGLLCEQKINLVAKRDHWRKLGDVKFQNDKTK